MSGPIETAGIIAPVTPTQGMSIAESRRAIGRDIDEANSHGFILMRSLSGLHIGHALWTGENWETITHVSHTPTGTTIVTEVGSYPFALDRRADVTKYRTSRSGSTAHEPTDSLEAPNV